MTNQPVFAHLKDGHFALATFGGNHEPLTQAQAFLETYKTRISQLVFPPSNAGETGFQTIEVASSEFNISSDGILVRPGQTIGIYSRDCPITFLYDNRRHEGVLFHCGRAAMSPRPYAGDPAYTVVTSACNTLRNRGSDPSNLSAVITAGICAECFIHNLMTDARLLQPFVREHKWAIEPETGGLDLVGLIETELVHGGLKEVNIHHDGLCTKEHPGLSSKRGGDTQSNLTVVNVT